ncbi:MAG: PAS domain S-box protein [Planctomycetaceae bacterium]|nr:PAS domain S-box protein [Planctomycetaceae bacterium]
MMQSRRSGLSWMVALVSCAVLVGVQRLLPVPLSGILTSLVFICAVVGATTLGGWKSGLGTTVLTLASAVILFSPPYYVRASRDPLELIRLSAYALIGLILTVVCHALKRAWDQNEERRLHLELEASERRRAQRAEEESEQRFSRFMQQLPGLAWIKDLEGRYVFLNDAAERAFQRPRTELIGRTDSEIFDAETAQQFRENDERALASSSGIQILETLRDAEGVLRQSLVSKFSIVGAAAEDTLVCGMAIDITERMQFEQQLRRHKERLELAQIAAGIGTFEWNIQSGQVEWSETMFDLYGVHSSGFSGKHEDWLAFVHPDDRERTTQLTRQAISDHRPFDFEFRITRPDGRVRWISAFGRTHHGQTGQPTAMVGVNIDVTERREVEQRLRDADRRKDEFLAILAHELRNPLAPLRSGLDVLGMTPGLNPDVQSIREMMDRQLTHMVRLIDDLLDVSRIARNKLELKREPIVLQDVINSAVEIVHPAIQERGHRLEIDLPGTPISIDGDFTRLTQVFGNLLNNSAKYTPHGGVIKVAAIADDNQVSVTIHDNGIGIPAESLAGIFGMFSQVDKSLGRTSGGLGIGLALVKALVEMHGGTVAARSAGRALGSEFQVTLPCQRFKPPAPRSPKRAPRDDVTESRKVLVADDNGDAGKTLALALKLNGFETRTASDGLEALAIAESFRPDVVLLDIGMPKLDGYSTAEKLRATPWGRSARLIAVTGWGQEQDRERSRIAGFDDHLVKPVETNILLDMLGRL